MLPSDVEAALSESLLPCLVLLTVVLNLLVIISISHFRQLQSPTNLLLLSLAVSDFLVGFFQMPTATLLFRGCWILSDFICIGTYVFGALILGASVGNMLLISIDRYMAICEPMLYCIRVTARAMRSHVTAVTHQQTQTVKPKRSEIKAAVTLGIVVAVFLLCYCPYYCFAMASLKSQVKATSSALQLLLLYINSSLNPMIYAFFYPWFRKAIRHIVTLQILQPGSSQTRFK
ncbi:trace amine-associated receptor 1-like [Echeneis naucrates]|uniref:trace amine-associated receptor 1-like n=1 Tax=Echeneis naucrates TaxID=173247 RepID=UPI0011134775|nr:trace amine-associated receptor 1-like [Echeneis naucrates]